MLITIKIWGSYAAGGIKMWRYKDDGNPHEKLVRAERHLMRWMDKLRQAEFEYQIEKARRIASDGKRSSYREAMKMKEIKYCIGQCKAIEKIYNRDAEVQLDQFVSKVFDEDGYEVTRDILVKKNFRAEANRTRNTEYQRVRRYAKRNVAVPTSHSAYPEVPQSEDKIERMREEILANLEAYKNENK